jgi:DNA-binding PadR family transcriptional regulator
MAEMKVVLYLLRHTWGFSEFGKPKKLTTDEFANGRKKRDQSRMDAGTGLSENSVRAGLDKAVEHGFIAVETDESDKARIEKWYCLNMQVDSEIESRPAKIAPLDSEIAERSEKETTERKERKPDLIDHLLDMANFPGAKAEARRAAIQSYLGERLHVNTETKAWREFAKYVDGQQQAHGEKVEVFIGWLLGQDKFQIQYWPPRRMQEMWPQAFIKNETQERTTSTGFYA